MTCVMAPRRLQPAFLLGSSGGFESISSADLLDGDREMISGGTLGDRQPLGDVGDGRATRGGGEHVALPRRQRVVAVAQRRERKAGIDDSTARHHGTDRLRQFGRWCVLQQEANGAAVYRTAQIPG